MILLYVLVRVRSTFVEANVSKEMKINGVVITDDFCLFGTTITAGCLMEVLRKKNSRFFGTNYAKFFAHSLIYLKLLKFTRNDS